MQRLRRVGVWVAGGDGGASGIGVYFREMIPRLEAELGKDDVDLVAIGTASELEAADATRHALVLPQALDASALGAAAAIGLGTTLAARCGAGVLYLPAANRRIAISRALPVVGTVHDLAQLAPGGRYGVLRDSYVRRVVAPSLRRMKKLLAISDATRRELVEQVGVDPARVKIVPNGVRFWPASRPRPAGRPRPYLLYPARLEHPSKNHVRLLEAFAASRARETHDLVLTGKDWGAGPLVAETTRRLGLEEHVDVRGFIGDDELGALLEHADVGVAAGVCEGFGLPAAEALAMGRPVVFAKAGALPEVVGDLGAGFAPQATNELRAAIDRAVFDEELRGRCADEGPTRAARFSWQDAARSTADALLEAGRAAA